MTDKDPSREEISHLTRYQQTLAGNRPADTPMLDQLAARPAQASAVPALPFSLEANGIRWIVTQILGAGGMGMTLLAHQQIAESLLTVQGGMGMTLPASQQDSKKAVIKIPLTDDPASLERFAREVHLLKKLDHPNIVHMEPGGSADISFAGESSPRHLPWFIMEYVQGPSLRQMLANKQRLKWDQAAELLAQMVSVFQYLENHADVASHRDIKPDNLIYDQSKRRWVLVDFGIAKALRTDQQLTVAGSALGSLAYMSPEQQVGMEKIDWRSDQYSLAVTLWEALIGCKPNRRTPLPYEYLGKTGVPADVDLLLDRMLQDDPQARYQSPGEILTALDQGVARHSLRQGRGQRFKKWKRRAVVAVALVLAFATYWWIGNIVCELQAKEIYLRHHQQTAAQTIRELQQFADGQRFWALGYVADKMAELEPQAAKERAKMAGLHQELTRISDAFGSQPLDKLNVVSLTDAQQRCKHFLTTYREAFPVSPEIAAIQAKEKWLGDLVIRQEQHRLVQEVLKVAAAKEKDKEFEPALDLCHNLLKNLTLPEFFDQVSKRRDELLRKRLEQIQDATNSTDLVALQEAADTIDSLQRRLGSLPRLVESARANDAAFWEVCGDKAQTALNKPHFTAARAEVDFYLKRSRNQFHLRKAQILLAKIDDQEDDFFWAQARAQSNQKVKGKNFREALAILQAYKERCNKGKDKLKGSHLRDADLLIGNVIDHHYLFVLGVPHWKEFNRQALTFIAAYPERTKQAGDFKSRMCALIHKEVDDLLRNPNFTSEAKIQRWNALDSSFCEQHQRNYLERLVSKAQTWSGRICPETMWNYEQVWRSPPVASLVAVGEPRAHKVTLYSMRYVLSASYYAKLKGANNANPRVEVHHSSLSAPFKWSGPQYDNKTDFTVTPLPPLTFYCDQYSPISVFLKDDDTVGELAPELRVICQTKDLYALSSPITYPWTQDQKHPSYGTVLSVSYAINPVRQPIILMPQLPPPLPPPGLK